MATALFNPVALKSATQPQPDHTLPISPSPQILQLIDAREVIRLLTFSLQTGSRTDQAGQIKFCKAALAHIHHGGLLTNLGLKDASGAIQPAQPAEGVKVHSLWVCSLRGHEGQYWRAREVYGYKPNSFPHTKESRLVLEALRQFLPNVGQQAHARPGAEYLDLCAEILDRGLHGSASRVLLLSSNKQVLQLTRESQGLQVCKVALRENAGQRVMGVRDAFGWLSAKLGHASQSKQALFMDLNLPDFLSDPSAYLARWDSLERLGIKQLTAEIKAAEGALPLVARSLAEQRKSEHYPQLEENCVSEIAKDLHAFIGEAEEQKSEGAIAPGQLAALERYLISSGQGRPIAKIKVPVRFGVFNV